MAYKPNLNIPPDLYARFASPPSVSRTAVRSAGNTTPPESLFAAISALPSLSRSKRNGLT